MANTLRLAMTENQNLHVVVASGYYDLATPYFAATYTIDHLGLDPSLRPHISQTFYEAGHMVYIHYPDLARLKSDARAMYERAMASPGGPPAGVGGAGGGR